MSSHIPSRRSHDAQAAATQGITVTRRITQRSRIRNADDSFDTSASFEEGFSMCAFGDLSMSEAYNAPAPTTGEYPLKLKRTRPPKPKKIQIPREESEGLSNLLHQLCKPSLNEHPLSPASDFKRFVEGLQSAKAASPFLSEMAGVSKHTQARPVTGAKVPLRGDAALLSPATPSISKAKTRPTTSTGTGRC